MEETINLQEIFNILKKRISLILTCMFVLIGIAGILTFFVITPKYSSSVSLMTILPTTDGNNSNASINDANYNLTMINTYKVLIKSDAVLNEVQQDLAETNEFKGTAADIKQMISVTQEQNSQMFLVNVVSSDPNLSESIANSAAISFQKILKDVNEKDQVAIISPAKANPSQVSPNNKLNLMIGLIVGLMVGVGVAFLFEFLDKTVKDDRFVVETLEFSILGTVPQMTPKELNAKLVKTVPVNSPVAEEDLSESDLNRRTRSRV